MTARQRVRLLVLAGGALGALAAAPGAAAAAELIEGTWLFQDGEVLVQPTGPGAFEGTVVKPTRFTVCTHPAGERMWQINGSGSAFTGTHIWYRVPTCDPDPGGQSTWTITSTDASNFTLRFCTARPGTGAPAFDAAGNPLSTTQCHDLKRVLAPQPTPTFERVVSLPKQTRKCRSRRNFRIRLREPKADPLVSATVHVNGKRVKVLKGKRLTAPVDLRGLPKGRYTVKIVATTTTGRVIQGTRRYRTCVPKRR